MPTLNLRQLNELMTDHPGYALEGLAAEFLEAFEPDAPSPTRPWIKQTCLTGWWLVKESAIAVMYWPPLRQPFG
jgi:hypothetical protein